MIRAAALVSGDGALLQTVLDSMYFGEIPNFELTAVICTESDAYALRRARNSGVEAFVVEPSLFPTKLSYSMAISNKLRDMDIDLVILAGYNMPLGVISTQFRKRIIGVYPSLIPAFVNCDDAPERAALERGCRVTGATAFSDTGRSGEDERDRFALRCDPGATAFFADIDGNIGAIIAQQAVDILPNDTPESLSRRILEDAEWKLLPQAISLYCQGRLEIHGDRVIIK